MAGVQIRPRRNAYMERVMTSTWRKSRHRNIRWAGRQRNMLRKLMGYVCWNCQQRKRSIHFDVIIPVHPPDGHGRKLSWDQRMRYYLKQWALGNLRLACATCNGRKGATDDKEYHRLMSLAGHRQAGDDDVEHEPATTVTDDVPF